MLQGLALSILSYKNGIMLLSWACYIMLIFISRHRNNSVMKKLIAVASTKHKLLSLVGSNICCIRSAQLECVNSVLQTIYRVHAFANTLAAGPYLFILIAVPVGR
jgi:predicted ferric reductase